MKRIIIIILAIVMVTLPLVACGSQDTPAQTPAEQPPADPPGETQAEEPPAEAPPAQDAEPGKKFTIGVSYQGPNNDWAINMKAHLEYGFADHQDIIERVIYKEYGWDEDQQIADLEDFLLAGIDLLIVAPHSDTGQAGAIADIKAAGIHVVVYNGTAGTDEYDALIKGDNVAAGQADARWLVDRLGHEGNILIIGGAPGSTYQEDLNQGYMDIINEYPGHEVLGIEYAFWSPASSKEIIESYIARGDQIDGIIVSGLMGLGALEAFTDAGLPIPPLTSGDGWTGFLFRAQELGFTDFAAIPTNNFDYAYGAVGLAMGILRGETVQRDTLIPPNPTMPAEEMLGMLTDNIPEAFWFGGLIPMADFDRFANA